jgi:ABC-type sugar transport system substrate-binding protein
VTLKKAVAAHIPVIDDIVSDPGQSTDGIYTQVTVSMTNGGAVQAAYAVQQAHCAGTIGLMTLPPFVSNLEITNGGQAEVKKLCKACTVDVQQVSAANLESQTGPLVQDMIRNHSDLKAIVFSNDAFVLLAEPAVKAAHASVRLVGFNGDASNLPDVANGTEAADLSFPPLAYVGWVLVDEAIRALLNEPPAPTYKALPTELLSGSGTSTTNPFPDFGDYEAAFKAAWGIDG